MFGTSSAAPAATVNKESSSLPSMAIEEIRTIPAANSIDRKKNCKRRFSDEQTKYLETMFATEARPELRAKQKLANKLGLQPRQVAIWFQNKRARSKSKQIEHDYTMLKIACDRLASQCESLKKENQSLLVQLQTLKTFTESPDGSRDCWLGLTRKSSHGEFQNQEPVSETEDRKPDLSWISNYGVGMPFCKDNNNDVEYLEQTTGILNAPELADSSPTSTKDGYGFESGNLLDNWEF